MRKTKSNRPNAVLRRHRRGGRAAIALTALCLLAACATSPQNSQASHTAAANSSAATGSGTAPSSAATQGTYGVASWYGGRYHGRQTASGEPFDMNALTAAHPSLPFGTRVRVTNLENSRSVVLRINDRGPFVKRRIIDVSRRAAEELGFIRQGVARVRVDII